MTGAVGTDRVNARRPTDDPDNATSRAHRNMAVTSPDVSEPNVPERLPRGPHRLSRTEVTESQRSRLTNAMIDAVAEKGYANTTVRDVLVRAKVSRATFYELFDDKADCFGAAYTSVTELLAQAMATPSGRHDDDEDPDLDNPGDVIAVIDAMVGGYLSLLAQSPNLAKVFLIEAYASGPVMVAKRRSTIDSIVGTISRLLDNSGLDTSDFDGSAEDLAFAIKTLVTALVALATETIAADEPERLTELHPPFMALVTRVLAPMSAASAEPIR